MKDFFLTTEKLTEASKKGWNLYAPVRATDVLVLELAYWAEAPKNDDVFVCDVTAFYPRHVTAFSIKDIDDELTYHAIVPETWAEAQIWHERLSRNAERGNIIVKLLEVPVAFCVMCLWILSVPIKMLSGRRISVSFLPYD